MVILRRLIDFTVMPVVRYDGGLNHHHGDRAGTQILMCPPDYFAIEYEINPWMNVRVGSDAALARQQWNCAPQDTRGPGGVGRPDRAGAGLPDLVFTANAGLVFRDLFYRLAVPLRRAAGRGAPL